MNTMNIPGFTAEASLYTTTGHYQWIRNSSAETGRRGVIILQTIPELGEVVTHTVSCEDFNGLPMPVLVVVGRNGLTCRIYREYRNCRAVSGGCACDSVVVDRTGDC